MNYKETDIFRLKLTLRDTDQDSYSEEEWDILQKYGKVTHSISRTILVPADTTLHCFHFIIQVLFGFMHEHEHHFMLDDHEMKQLVHDHVQEYCDLCGIYFQFPDCEIYDQDWDDDYQPGQSGKKWMQSKYLKPTELPFYSESYFENQRMIHKWKNRLNENKDIELDKYDQKMFHIDSKTISFDECPVEKITRYTFEKDGRALCEKLMLKQLLHTNTQSLKDEYISFVQESIQSQTDHFTAEQQEEYEKYADEYLSYVRQHLFPSADELKEENKKKDLFLKHVNPEIEHIPPVTNKLVYCYDNGDGWMIDIQILNTYSAASKNHFVDENNQKIQGSLQDKLINVYHKKHPLCVEKDGLDVIEDVGGVKGYVDFLRELNEGDEKERESCKSWSRTQGWSGRDVHWSKIL